VFGGKSIGRGGHRNAHHRSSVWLARDRCAAVPGRIVQALCDTGSNANMLKVPYGGPDAGMPSILEEPPAAGRLVDASLDGRQFPRAPVRPPDGRPTAWMVRLHSTVTDEVPRGRSGCCNVVRRIFKCRFTAKLERLPG